MVTNLYLRILRRTFTLMIVLVAAACVAQDGMNDSAGGNVTRVLVAGATGGTGQHIVKDLITQGYTVRAFVRDLERAQEKLGTGIEYAVGDVKDRASIDAAMDDVDAVISAIGAVRGDPANTPEAVDYGGSKNLAEAAAAAGAKQFVMVSSAGVTQEDHFLNKMFLNVLNWKFKGEEALRNSGVPYTIIRPGGLLNEPPGTKELIFKQGDDKNFGSIPRADVARLCVASLAIPDARRKTFEVISGDGPHTDNWAAQFAALQAN